MNDDAILDILKIDLSVSSEALDSYLLALIAAARSRISIEGINLTDSVDDAIMVESYAAWLYRHRRDPKSEMPRELRWALNNRLFSQKGEAKDG